MLVASTGMLVFYMLGGALRSAGDARTPMVLGLVMTAMNIALNVVFIRGLGPIPAFGTLGSAMGTTVATGTVAAYSIWKLWSGGWVVHFPRERGFAPDWEVIRSLFRLGLPAGFQGIAMNVGGVLLLSFIGSLPASAAAQAAYAVSYTELFSLITWTASALMGATATVAGQNLGAGQLDRVEASVGVSARYGLTVAAVVGAAFLLVPRLLLAAFGLTDTAVVELGVLLLRVLSLSGLFVVVALTFTGALQGTGDTKSPLYISLVSQLAVPLGLCALLRATGQLAPLGIWLAILAGHATRASLSVWRFRQGGWRARAAAAG
jgi:Na+-driven multidrug efflux pump